MDVEESENEPRSGCEALRNALHKVIFTRSRLVGCCFLAREGLERHGNPHPSEWLVITPGDEKLLTAKKRKTRFVGNRSLSDEDWLARDVVWPKILNDLQRSLDHFRKAIGAAKTAFDQLPPEVAARIAEIDRPEWAVRLRLLIDSLGDWFRWTGPRTPGERSDVAGIVNRLNTSEPPSCDNERATIRVWDQILWSITQHDQKSRQTKRQFPSEAYVTENLANVVQTSKLPIKASKDNPDDGPHHKAMMAFLRPYIATPHERTVWGYFYKLQELSPADRELIERAAKDEGMPVAEFSSREILEQLRYFVSANEIPFLGPNETPQSDVGGIEKQVATQLTKTKDVSTATPGGNKTDDAEPVESKSAKRRKEWSSEPPPEGSRHKFGPLTGNLKQFAELAGMDPRTLRSINGKSFFYIRKINNTKFEIWLESAKRFADWNAQIGPNATDRHDT